MKQQKTRQQKQENYYTKHKEVLLFLGMQNPDSLSHMKFMYVIAIPIYTIICMMHSLISMMAKLLDLIQSRITNMKKETLNKMLIIIVTFLYIINLCGIGINIYNVLIDKRALLSILLIGVHIVLALISNGKILLLIKENKGE